MATLSPDVRNSTLRSLKLTCPSAEVVHADTSSPETESPAMPHANPSPNPFGDAAGEWSDEEELIPRNRRKTQYMPHHVKVTATLAESSSEASTPTPPSPSPSRLDVHGNPVQSPKYSSAPHSHHDLVQRLHQVSSERDALRKELQQQSTGPDGICKSEEQTLIQELHALRYEIRIWSEAYFTGPIKTRSKRPYLHRAKHLFGTLTNNYTTYLKSPSDRPLLIQAYIWSKLQTKIFSTCQKGSGYIWAGALGDKHLRPLNDTLRKAVRNPHQAHQYHQWRALTVNLLVPQIDGKWRPTFDPAPILKRISRISSRIRHRLRPWSTHSLHPAKHQLHTILSAAVALDLKLKRQLPDYRFVTFTGGKQNQFFGYGFYDDEMQDIDHHHPTLQLPHRKIELALAPALERCGNANGFVLERNFILVKAHVSCRRLPAPESLPKHPKDRAGLKRGMGALAKAWDRFA